MKLSIGNIRALFFVIVFYDLFYVSDAFLKVEPTNCIVHIKSSAIALELTNKNEEYLN